MCLVITPVPCCKRWFRTLHVCLKKFQEHQTFQTWGHFLNLSGGQTFSGCRRWTHTYKRCLKELRGASDVHHMWESGIQISIYVYHTSSRLWESNRKIRWVREKSVKNHQTFVIKENYLSMFGYHTSLR